MATVPMIGPDGSVADVPQASVAGAAAQGAKVAFDMISPDGKERATVPADQVHSALAQGAQLASLADAARFAGASVPRPPDAIRSDDAKQPHYSDIIGPNGGPGAPGEYENSLNANPAEIAKGVGKAAVKGAVDLATSLGTEEPPAARQERERETQELQPSNTDQQVGADTLNAATTSAGAASAVTGLPELFESLANVLRGGKAAESAAVAEHDPAAAQNPSLIEQLRQGQGVARPRVDAAIRAGVQKAEENTGINPTHIYDPESGLRPVSSTPILRGNETILDDRIAAIGKAEKAAYKQVDDTVGFDLKAEKAQLSNDKYKLSQLGNTDADITQRGKLIESINDSQDRITDAEQKLREAGIDPKAADTLHQQRMAAQEFKKALVKNIDPDGRVNMQGLLKDSQKLRFSKYGDRLTQFMGKEGADQYMTRMIQAYKQGIRAMKLQKWTVGVLGVGGGAGVYEGYRVLSPSHQ